MATSKASAKAAPATLVLSFELEKETKGTHRFQETDSEYERPAVGSLYVTKEALAAHGLDGAKKLQVTVEAVDG